MTKSMVNHLVVDTPMTGIRGKWSIATVIRGNHAGKHVCIMVEFSDGWCICDMGNDDPMQTIKIEDMALWVSVQVAKSSAPKEAARKRWNRLRKILTAPNHMIKSEKQRFSNHLEAATKIVESWPEWKRNVLTYSSQSERSR